MTRSSVLVATIVGAGIAATGALPRVSGQTGQPAISSPASSAIDAIVEKPIKAGKVAGASVSVTRAWREHRVQELRLRRSRARRADAR